MNDLMKYKAVDDNVISIIEFAEKAQCIQNLRKLKLYDEISEILFDLVKYFNRNISTSVSKKTYRRIMQSLNYIVLHGFQSNENVYQALNDTSIAEFYQVGLAAIKRDLQKVQIVFQDICKNVLPFSNSFFKNVIEEQIPTYLRHIQSYEGVFYYCDMQDDLDYPLINGLPLYHDMYHLQGSDLVLYYIQQFHIENQFCSNFKAELPELICQYEALKGINVTFLSLNLFSLLLQQIMGNVVLGRGIQIFLQNTDIKLIKRKVELMGLEAVWKATVKAVRKHFSMEICEYIEKHKSDIVHHLEQFLLYDFEMFIYPISPDDKKEIVLYLPENNRIFEDMLRNIMRLTKVRDKINYMKKNVKSIYDVIDLLESDVFYYEEYEQYFAQLTPTEVAILIQVTYQNVMVFHQQITLHDIGFYMKNDVTSWKVFLYAYLRALNENRKKAIELALSSINICL